MRTKSCGSAKCGKDSCIECHRDNVREYKKRNADKIRKQKLRWYERKKKDGHHLASHMKVRFGITQDEYSQTMKSTEGKCEICGTSILKLVLDHNHDTGEIRGVLCNNCNGGLGMFGDNISSLESAICYLKHRGSYGK